MNMDQQLGNLIVGIEKLVTQGLNVGSVPEVAKRIKVGAIKSSVNQRLPEDSFKQAQAWATSHPNSADLAARFNKLQARDVKGHRELLVMLHQLSTDPALSALTNGPLNAKDTAKQPVPSASTRPVASSRPAVAAVPGATRAQASAAATPSSAMGSGVQVSAYSTPIASMPAVSTPMGTMPAAPAAAQQRRVSGAGLGAQAGAGVAAAGSAFGATQLPRQAAASAAPQQLESPRPTASNPSSAARLQASLYSNNLYGQEGDMTSPAMRHKDYTPSLAPTLNYNAARMRAASSVADPQPNVPAAGDLFSCKPVPQQPAGVPKMSAAGLEAFGELPAWNSERPHLTGLDLVRAAQAGTAAASTPGAHASLQASLDALSSLPAALQELTIMNDLLYAFLGLEGRYVRARLLPQLNAPTGTGPSLTFVVVPGLEPSLQELVERVLPLCEYVVVLQRFVETRSAPTYGLVSQAVAAAVRGLLQDWTLMVTQLEHQLRLGRLTLQALVFYCQGPLASLGLLANTVASAASARLTSAGLLNLLHAKAAALAGDRVGRALLHRTLHAAAVPYFRCLERWLCEGVLDDPHGEFMVQEDKSADKEVMTEEGRVAFWYSRYTLRRTREASFQGQQAQLGSSSPGSPPQAGGRAGQGQEAGGQELDVPVFLAGAAHLILTTGKYLNAMRECGQPLVLRPLPPGQSLSYDPGHSFLQVVHSVHVSASGALLQLLLSGQGLVGWLRSLKHWFLLDAGDVVVGLVEAMGEELGKAAKDVSRPRLQSLLELAVRMSSVAQDPHVDNLVVDLDPRSLLELARGAGVAPHPSVASAATTPMGTPGASSSGVGVGGGLRLGGRARGEELPGWEVVTLSYRTAWPLNLVVPPAALARYQLIFRYLWGLKHAERELSTAWHRMQAGRNASRAGRDALKHAYALTYRHLFLVKELVRYATVDVLEPAWQAMEEGMRRATDVDQVISCHDAFLARAMDGLLLSRPTLLKPVLALTGGALAFCARVARAWDTLDAQVAAAQKVAAEAERERVAALQRSTSAAARNRASGSGAVRVPVSSSGGSLAARREAGYASLSVGGAGAAAAVSAALGAPSTAAPSPTATIDLEGLATDMARMLGELVAGLGELYRAAMQREAAADGDGSSQAGLETREGLEALQGLIERLDLGGGSGTGGGAAAAGGAHGGTRAAYAALAAQAAALG